MGETKRQRKREQVARLCEQVSRMFNKQPSQAAKELRAINRRVGKRKRREQ